MDVQADAATDESMDGRKDEHKYDDPSLFFFCFLSLS